MNFDFSDEMKMLRQEAKKFLSARCSSAAVRKVLDGRDSYDSGLYEQMAKLGWMGSAIPEQFGGAGLGQLALCVLAEELGHALAPVPFSSSIYMAAEGLNLAGSGVQKERWLPQLAGGEVIGTLATAEYPGQATKHRPTVLKAGKISGTKTAVPDGDIADFAIVSARSELGVELGIVELEGPGVKRANVDTVDPSRSHATIVFESANFEPLGKAGEGSELLQQLVNRAAVLIAFEQLGGAQAALDMACKYARERYAFGRPIGSNQAIKHKLADVYVAVELARSNAYYGAWALSTNASELPVAAAAARISASEAFWLAAKENIQVHGGMGYTWEMDCHLYYRRAKLLGLTLGSVPEWKNRLIDAIESQSADGALRS